MRNNKKERDFEKYKNNLDEADFEKVSGFFDDLKARTCCFGDGFNKIRRWYEAAFLYYFKNNLTVDEIIKRLDHSHLSGFYARRSSLWYSLDIVGSYKSIGFLKGKKGIYEIIYVCEEDIIPSLLQIALCTAVKRYPFFACRLKKGFFGYYLDCEKKISDVCQYVKSKDLLCDFDEVGEFFKLYYSKNKIVLAFVDGITDCYGAQTFLECVNEYYSYLLCGVLYKELESKITDLPTYEENSNGFDSLNIYPREFENKKEESITLEGDLYGDGIWKTHCCTLVRRDLERVVLSRKTDAESYFLEVVFNALKYSTDRLSGEIAIGVSWDGREKNVKETVRNFTCERIFSADCREKNVREKINNLFMSAGLKKWDLLENLIFTLGAIKNVPLIFKPLSRVYGNFKKHNKYTCSFGCFYANNAEMYITFKPCECGTGFFVTFLQHRVVVSVSNNGTDPSFFEKLERIFREDGISLLEDREIIKCKVE